MGLVIQNHFELGPPLGAGGMGVVYRGRDTLLDRPVALKFLPPRLADSESAYLRFLAEARLVSRLRHPNVVTLYSFGRAEDGTLYFAMEYASGGSLRDWLRDGARGRGPLAEADVVSIGHAVATGLGAAHAIGVVHRDLKPANILLGGAEGAPGGKSGPWTVKVADFGLAKALGDVAADGHITAPGTIVGSPAYMAPEQARGEPVDARSDVYSLGVLLYEMLAGALPYRGATMTEWLAVIEGVTPVPPSRVRGEQTAATAPLDALVMSMLAKEPSQRPVDGEAVAALLADLASRYPEPSTLLAAFPWQESRAGLRGEDAAPRREPAHARAVVVVAFALHGGRRPSPDEVAQAEHALNRMVRERAQAERAVAMPSHAGLAGMVLGVPISTESDLERGLRIAWDLRETWAARSEADGLMVSCGVEVGRALVEHTPSALHLQGEPSLRAFRLAASHPSSEVWLGPEAHFAAGELPLSDPDANGAVRLLGPPTAPPSAARGSWIGRAAELSALQSHLDAGHPGTRVVWVTGAWGIGKSSLVSRAMDGMAEAPAATITELECEQSTTAPLHPFASALRRELESAGFGAADPLEGVRRIGQWGELRGCRWTTDDATCLWQWLYPTAGELGETVGATSSETGQMESRRPEGLLFALLARWLRPSGRAVVVLEDAQWADETTLDFLHWLIGDDSDRAGSPCCIVVVSRDDVDGTVGLARRDLSRDWPDRVATLVVGPLSREESADLVRARARRAEGPADAEPLDEHVVAHVVDRARGVPAMLVRLAGWASVPSSEGLGATGVTSSYDGSDAASARGLFASHARWMARAEGLSAPLREALDAAAVLHPGIWAGAVAALLAEPDGPAPRPLVALQSLEDAGWLVRRRRSRVPDEHEYAFADEHAADALEMHIRDARKRAYHSRAARWGRERFLGDDGLHLRDEWASWLAHHYDGAGEPTAALPLLARAAAYARRQWDLRAAAGHTERWLALAPSDAADRAERTLDAATVWLQQGVVDRAVRLAGEVAEVAQVEAGAAPVPAADTLARAREILGSAALAQGDLAGAEAQFEAAQLAAESTEMKARAAARTASVWLRQGQFERVLAELAPPADVALRTRAQVATIRSAAFRRLGRIDEAKRECELARDWLEQAADPAGAAVVVNNLAVIRASQGDFASAEALLRDALRRYERAGAMGGQAGTAANLGEILLEQGRVADSIGTLARAINLARSARSSDALAEAARHLARAYAAQGARHEARQWARRAVEYAERTGQSALVALALDQEAKLAVDAPPLADG